MGVAVLGTSTVVRTKGTVSTVGLTSTAPETPVSTSTTDPEPPDSGAGGGRTRRAWRWLRPHLPFAALVGLGVALRWLFTVAYRPAFWFHGDSGQYIDLAVNRPFAPHPTRPLGYVALVRWLSPTRTLSTVVRVQHVLGLLLAVAVYALLLRRGVSRRVACLATVPLLFDSLVLTAEHYVLADTLYTALLAGAVLVLLWSPRPGYPAVVASGLLVAASWFTKPTALPVAALLALYLLVRRVGWLRLAAYAVAFAIPYGYALHWIDGRPSVYGGQSVTALYGRTAIVADCAHLKLTATERLACPDQPPGRRWDRADAFYWRRPARLDRPDGPAIMTAFAVEVLKQQPLDYLAVVGRETAAHFVPGLYLGPMNECLRERMVPPVRFRDTLKSIDRCPPAQAAEPLTPWPTRPQTAPEATSLTRALHTYGEWGRSNPLVMSLCVLLVLAALVRGRRVAGRTRLDCVLLALAGPGLTVLTVAVGMYEPRYALPALPLAVVAAALAWTGLRNPPQPAAVVVGQQHGLHLGPQPCLGADLPRPQAS